MTWPRPGAGASGWIRTTGPGLRKAVLWSAELRTRELVPSVRVERTCLATPASETGASANSATRGDLEKWSPQQDSNLRPDAPKATALPTALHGEVLAPRARLERATSGFVGRRSDPTEPTRRNKREGPGLLRIRAPRKSWAGKARAQAPSSPGRRLECGRRCGASRVRRARRNAAGRGAAGALRGDRRWFTACPGIGGCGCDGCGGRMTEL